MNERATLIAAAIILDLISAGYIKREAAAELRTHFTALLGDELFDLQQQIASELRLIDE